jgi:hypothetical protein
MTHPTEGDLVLLYYGDHEDPAAIETHLENCPACHDAMASLRADLALARLDAPEPGAAYGARMWVRVEPLLSRVPAGPVSFFRRRVVRRAAGYLALAACLAAAFILGRALPRGQDEVSVVADARERVLLAAVARHLDRSQRVLVELAHADEGHVGDLSARAERLVAENRLYRQSAQQAGEVGLASLLDDLGRVLVEVANTPAPLTPGDVRDLNARVERKELLFKVRVVGSRLMERERTSYGAKNGSSL